MSAFKVLRDVINNFEDDLRRVSTELFTARKVETFEDIIAKKLLNLSLYTSKLRLLQAKREAATQTAQHDDEQRVLANYTDTVKQKLLEKQAVKAITQAHAVKVLLTTNDSSLDPEMVERKEKIIEQLTKFKDKETQLCQLKAMHKEREEKLLQARQEWDNKLGVLREMRMNVSDNTVEDQSSPLSSNLRVLESKLTVLRSLLARLATARAAGYDWLADPHRRLRALRLARQYDGSGSRGKERK